MLFYENELSAGKTASLNLHRDNIKQKTFTKSLIKNQMIFCEINKRSKDNGQTIYSKWPD